MRRKRSFHFSRRRESKSSLSNWPCALPPASGRFFKICHRLSDLAGGRGRKVSNCAVALLDSKFFNGHLGEFIGFPHAALADLYDLLRDQLCNWIVAVHQAERAQGALISVR